MATFGEAAGRMSGLGSDLGVPRVTMRVFFT